MANPEAAWPLKELSADLRPKSVCRKIVWELKVHIIISWYIHYRDSFICACAFILKSWNQSCDGRRRRESLLASHKNCQTFQCQRQQFEPAVATNQTWRPKVFWEGGGSTSTWITKVHESFGLRWVSHTVAPLCRCNAELLRSSPAQTAPCPHTKRVRAPACSFFLPSKTENIMSFSPGTGLLIRNNKKRKENKAVRQVT